MLSPNRLWRTVPLTLESAHIIPHSLSEAKTELDCEQKRKIWQALGIFAGHDIGRELDIQKIDALDNIIILQHDAHVYFGKFNLWFTADEVIPKHSNERMTNSLMQTDTKLIWLSMEGGRMVGP